MKKKETIKYKSIKVRVPFQQMIKVDLARYNRKHGTDMTMMDFIEFAYSGFKSSLKGVSKDG
jgi:hypothetical protein